MFSIPHMLNSVLGSGHRLYFKQFKQGRDQLRQMEIYTAKLIFQIIYQCHNSHTPGAENTNIRKEIKENSPISTLETIFYTQNKASCASEQDGLKERHGCFHVIRSSFSLALAAVCFRPVTSLQRIPFLNCICILHIWVLACMHPCTIPTGTRRGHQIPWDQSTRRQAANCFLGEQNLCPL